MSTFAVLLLCIQACLVQNVFGQLLGGGCGCGASALGPAPAAGIGSICGGALGLDARLAPATAGGGALGHSAYGGTIGSAYGGARASTAAYGGAMAPGAAFGGAGEGNVAVIGELPVAGTTAVAGQVPIMGAVSFSGPVAASGAVSIRGQCACGCGSSI